MFGALKRGAAKLFKATLPASSLLLTACGGSYSTLNPAGPQATGAAWLWWGMFSFFTLVYVVVVILWFVGMKRDPGKISDEQAQRVQNRWILWGGLVLPGVSVTAVLAFGLPVGRVMIPLPPEHGEAVEVHVSGQQWLWQTAYPDTDLVLENRVRIPAGVPIDVHLTSRDVIHSFWVPRLAGKMDAIPGHVNVLRIEASEPGTYRGHCAEFCGTRHAHMHFVVEALPRQEFENWLEDARSND